MKKHLFFSSKLVKILLLAIGSLAVILGIIGIFLPLLPTTPFLLLAAFCYAKSSERFYTWLLTNRLCGKYIRNYRAGLGMQLSHKIFTLLLLWLTIGFSVLRIVTGTWVKLALLLIATAVTIHLIALKTYRCENKQNNQSQ